MHTDITKDELVNDRNEAIGQAKVLLEFEDLVILDTETTGLDSMAEIVEIAAVNRDGEVLLNSLVCPTRPIPIDATRIHGITDLDVRGAPSFVAALSRIEFGRVVAIYNAGFDVRLMEQSARSHRPWREMVVQCIMELYATFYGAWSSYHESYTWQSLTIAVAQCGLSWDGQEHRALADARMALRVLKYMAEQNA